LRWAVNVPAGANVALVDGLTNPRIILSNLEDALLFATALEHGIIKGIHLFDRNN
jgi:predicted nucleic acid-binding protein